jgi:hydroxyacylglutathione hydrolase
MPLGATVTPSVRAASGEREFVFDAPAKTRNNSFAAAKGIAMPLTRPTPFSFRIPIGATLTALALALASPAAGAEPLFAPWINGQSADEPITQVQRIDPDTFVIRQSIRTNFEGPFLYLLLGSDKALLLDTGAGGLEIRPTIDKLIAEWSAAHGKASVPLLVAHSHSHGDHHAGDAEFAARPDTTVIGLKPTDVAAAFGITDWPRQIATFDLGGRPLSIIPTPGHEPAHIAIYDPKTQILLSGDTLYPGRLYVPANWRAVFRESMGRMATHPNEHVLELAPAAAAELHKVADGMGDTTEPAVTDDFIVFPVEARLPNPDGYAAP